MGRKRHIEERRHLFFSLLLHGLDKVEFSFSKYSGEMAVERPSRFLAELNPIGEKPMVSRISAKSTRPVPALSGSDGNLLECLCSLIFSR